MNVDFYTHEPDRDGHRYTFEFDDMDCRDIFNEIVEWCTARFGGPAGFNSYHRSGSRWMAGDTSCSFWFRDEADAFEFRLRWC